MAIVNQDTIDQLTALARKRMNVLITGSHGIGKSEITRKIAEELGIKKVKYFSCATLDPWTDLVGIPIPTGNTLKFCRPKDVIDAEWWILDEINRAHPKVQNSLLEAVQFKSINNEPLKNLKMVWGIQNPPSKIYQVTQLDPVMVTRFHAHVRLEGRPDKSYLATKGINPKVAQSLCDWWINDLTDETREIVVPRQLEYIGRLIADKLDWKFAVADTIGVPLFALEKRLLEDCGISKYDKLTLKRICQPVKLDEYAELAATEKDFCVHVIGEAEKAEPLACWDAAEVITSMPAEFQMKLIASEQFAAKMLEEWPKLDETFYENEAVQQLYTQLKEFEEANNEGK